MRDKKLSENQVKEYYKWINKACDINIAMQNKGKPDDLPLGVSIVDYALDRLLEDVNAPRPVTAKGGE